MSVDKYHFTAANGDYSEVAPPEWTADCGPRGNSRRRDVA